MARIGLPSTLLLVLRSTSVPVHGITFCSFNKRINSDPDNIQVAFLGPLFTGTDHFLIGTKLYEMHSILIADFYYIFSVSF